MKTCIQVRRKTNLSSRPELSLKRLARGKGKSNRRKITREKQGWKWQWVCSGVGPRLFIGGKPQRSKILNLTVKHSASRAFEVFQARPSGTDALEDVFFHLDSRSSGFAGSGLHRGKRFAIEGLLLGDSESSLSYTKNKRMSLVAQVPVRKA
jgi:hypothetical protein